MERAIVVEDLGKRFRKHDPDRSWTIQQAVLNGLRGLRPGEQSWGLRHLSFEVAPGRMIGVIGRNGAGKSTLLRLLGGVSRPDEGSVKIRGRVSGLLSLGVGFHADLTGRENVYISGVISGLTRREVSDRFDAIVDFAELHHCIDSPLRTYSSGMQMRLGFAIGIHTDPDVLLIDEVLAVGDVAFQRKCLRRIAQLKAEGHTIVLVSHDAAQVRDLCEEVLWLERGRKVDHGPAAEVVRKYITDVGFETRRRTPSTWPTLSTTTGVELRVHENRFGSLEMEILDVRLLGLDGAPTAEVSRDDPLHVEFDYLVPAPVQGPIFGISIVDQDGMDCYHTRSDEGGIAPESLGVSGRLAVRIPSVPLLNGNYCVEISACDYNWTFAYDYHRRAYPLRVREPRSREAHPRPLARGKPAAEWTRKVCS